MIDTFLSGLESIFTWVIEASWQASVLVALVLLLHLIFRGRLNPRWHHALWLLVVARLLLPFLPESALSLFQFAPSPPPVVTETVTKPIFNAPPAPMVVGQAPAPTPPVAYPFSVFTVLALGWLIGALALLILTWQVNRRFARHVAAAPRVTNPRLLQLAEAAQQELGLHRRLHLIESAQVQSPAVMGLFRPTLILPTEVGTRFSDGELRFIFLHEFAHLKRGDLFLQWLVALLQIVHWFNPVLWYAFRRMRIDREPATDALVLSCTGEAYKESYGQVLMKLLEHYHQRHSLPTLVGILEDKEQFKRRFSLIAKFTGGAYGWSLLGVLLIGILAVACLTKTKASDLQVKAGAGITATDTADLEFQIAGQPVQLSEQAQKDTSQLVKELLVMRYINGTPEQVFHFQMLPNTTLKDIQNSGSFLHFAYAKEQIFRVGLHYSFKTKDIWIGLKDSVGAFPGYPGGIIVVTTDKKPPFNLVGGSKTLLVAMGLNPEIYSHLPAEMKKTLDQSRGDHQAFLDWTSKKDSSGESINQQAVIAVQAGDVATLRKLTAEGIDLKTIKGKAPTLLFYAESPEVAELLIQQGVDVNARDSTGNTALHRICRMPGPQATAIVRVLLDHDANVNASTLDGITPLMEASNPETVALLIQHGADVKAKLKGGTTMLQMAAQAKASVFETLLRNGASFDVKKDGPTLMLHAAWVNNTDLIKDLLNRGVDPNVKGVWAMVNGKPDLMLPLAAAVVDGRGQFDSVKLLLEHGAKADDVMSDAVFNRRAKIIKFFWDHGVRNIPELTYEVSQGAPVTDLQKLLDRGDPVDPREKTGITPLEDAAMLGNMDTVKLLIAHGANLNHGSPPDPKDPVSGGSPLASAASEGQDEIVSYLLSQGARPDYCAVWEAADNSDPYDDQRPRSHFEKTVRLLIDAGALKTVPPNVGGYLLGAAMGTRQGGPNATVLKMFLDAGLSPDSPMPYIVENGERPNSVIGYYRDFYAKYKDNPIYASQVSAIKPLLDMLEAADKTPATPSGKSTTSVKEPDPDAWTIRDLKVSDMPLTELANKLTAMTKADDPKGVGARIDVKVHPGERPLKITYGYPPYTGDLGNLLYHLADLYPIRYELQIASLNPDAQQAPITLIQLPAAEAQLNKKAGETKIDLDLSGIDFITALNAVQSRATTKGFHFEINVDALKGLSLPPVSIKARNWSVEHAILSLCYLADLVAQPLENFTGYEFRPGSVAELHDRTCIRFGIATAFYKADDKSADSNLAANLARKRTWGPAEVMPAYSWVYRGKEMNPMGGTIGTQFSYHHKASDPAGFVVPVDGAPHLEVKFKTFVADKTHIRTAVTLRLEKSDGTVLRELTGETTAPSGAILNLMIHGAPLQLDTPDDPTTKSNLYVFAQADYVDNGKRETDIEPEQLELVSPADIIQQVEMSDVGI